MSHPPSFSLDGGCDILVAQQRLARLFRIVSLSHLRTEAPRELLALFGIALGIAVYISIALASDAAKRSFSSTALLMGDGKSVALTTPSGSIAEKTLASLRPQLPHALFIPLSQRTVIARDGTPLTLYGTDIFSSAPVLFQEGGRENVVDFLRSSKYALVSADLLGRGALEIDLPGGAHSFTSLVPLAPPESLPRPERTVVIDISFFQELTGDYGTVDRVLVRSRDRSADELRAMLAAVAQPPVMIEEEDARERQAETMTRAFDLNVRFLSFIALFVSLFLIYNTSSHGILRRRREIGTLRTLGAPRSLLGMQLLAEAAARGLCGSIIGIAAGVFFARFTTAATAQTITNIYLPIAAERPVLTIDRCIEGLLLGPLVAVLGSLLPLREALSTSERATFSYQTFEESWQRSSGCTAALVGVLLLLLVPLTAREELIARDLRYGFVSPVLLALGTVAVIPLLLSMLCRRGSRLFHRLFGIEAVLALDHIQTTLRRNAVACGAMAVALGLFTGMAVMIASFRSTVDTWMRHITTADVYVSSKGATQTLGGELPVETVAALQALPDVETIDWVSVRMITKNDRRVRVQGVRFPVLAATGRYVFKRPVSQRDLEKEIAEPDTVYVSETFARRFNVSPGDPIEIPGTRDMWRGTVKNIFFDYSSDQGIILISDELFARIFESTGRQGVSLYLKSGTDRGKIVEDLQRRFGTAGLRITDSGALRKHVMDIFDRTFALTRALQVIALLVSLLTVGNAIALLIEERATELGVMRALGASMRSLRKMVVAEAMVLGAFSSFVALCLGLLLAVILVFVINRHFFAWTISFEIHLPALILPIALGFIVAPLAAVPLAVRGLRKLDARVLRYE